MAETAIERATTEIEKVLNDCNVLALKNLPALTQAVVLASGVSQLRKVLTDKIVEEIFMPLMGSPLGFVTDKDRDGQRYPVSVVRDCMIEAMINGFRPVGNEINIISGRMYGAKAGFQRKVSEFPGLTDLRLTPGVPHIIGDKGALVPFHASWRLDGKQMEIVRDVKKREDGTVSDTRIGVRVNSQMGTDAIIGKATRKMLKAIYDLISGSTLTVEDGDVLDTTGEAVPPSDPTPAPAPPEQDGQRISMKKTKSNPEASAPKNGDATSAADEILKQHRSKAEPEQETREPGQEG